MAAWNRSHWPPLDLSPARVGLTYRPVEIGALAPPARLAGAWQLGVDDPRFGGLSGLAIDRGRLLALTDTGMLAWLDRPGTAGAMVMLRALPAVSGDAKRKIGRDSEALMRDPAGRGWWVAFEQVHALLRFDEGFTRMTARVPVSSAAFRDNRGVEAIYRERGKIRWIGESTGVSDAVTLPDGQVVTIERQFGQSGFRSRLAAPGLSIALPLGGFDNPEGVTAEPLANGGTRLWIVTDNDFKAWRRTLLVAIDLPPAVPTPR